MSYLLLAEVVWQVGDHDLCLTRDAILWRTALLTLAGSSGLALAEGALCTRLGCHSLVGSLSERKCLAWYVGWSAVGSGFAVKLAILVDLRACISLDVYRAGVCSSCNSHHVRHGRHGLHVRDHVHGRG